MVPHPLYFARALVNIATMEIERDGVHFRILERLCGMPRAVRGISGVMLERHFNASWAVDELAAARLIQARGWANGPGAVWIPTEAGEAVYRRLTGNGVAIAESAPQPEPAAPIKSAARRGHRPRRSPARR
jgi:hypothetical protein